MSREEKGRMFERILVCLDGSKLAGQILPYAAEQAQRFDSRLVLLRVVTVPGSAYMTSATGIPVQTGEFIREEFRKQETNVRAYLETIAQSLQEKAVKTECVILGPAHVGRAIVGYARENAIDLICIATHGYSGLGRVVFGSVADYVLRRSGLPILVVKPQVAGVTRNSG